MPKRSCNRDRQLHPTERIQVQVEAEIDIQVERRNFAVSKSLTQSLTVGSVAFEKAGAHRVTHRADPARACHEFDVVLLILWSRLGTPLLPSTRISRIPQHRRARAGRRSRAPNGNSSTCGRDSKTLANRVFEKDFLVTMGDAELVQPPAGTRIASNCARCRCSAIHALTSDTVANGPTVVGWYSGLTISTENSLSTTGMTQ
jgi:hypothetical protein